MRRLTSLLLVAAAAGPMILFPRPALAQDSYPRRLITIIVPFSPGTGPDILARAISQKLAERWSVPVVVDNKPGASGNIGAELAAKAAGDGYTVMIGATTFALNAALSKATRYDPLRSFEPVGLVATGELAFAVNGSVRTRTLREFIAQARSRPGEIHYASSGNGTPQHLAMELFKQSANIDLTHVPYKDSAGAIRDLAGGHVYAMVIPVHTVAPLVTTGRARILAVFGKARSPVFPDAPTLGEAGFPSVEARVWFGLMVPASTAPDIVKKLNSEMNAILAVPEFRETLVRQGLAPEGGSPERFAGLIKSELERWTRVIAQAKIKAD